MFRFAPPPFAIIISLAASSNASAGNVDIGDFFAAAEKSGRVGVARKAKSVEARAASPGEVVVTIIKGEGVETRSNPAQIGDMVVRNRCEETGNEEILVKGDKFKERYQGPFETGEAAAAAQPWKVYKPRANDMSFAIVSEADGAFSFVAPWGEPMVARPGDAIVRDRANVRDTYRVARAAFSCTYVIIEQPGRQ